MTIEKGTIKEIDEIINLYAERMQWFKDNNIKQWSKYLTNHPKEQFVKVIEDGNYYILKIDNEIVGGFEVSNDNHFWNDDPNAYYLHKVVSKVGYRNIGREIFKKAKNMAIENGKKYLRIDCLASNKKLNDIYENYGFKYVKEGQDYYHYILREWRSYEKNNYRNCSKA